MKTLHWLFDILLPVGGFIGGMALGYHLGQTEGQPIALAIGFGAEGCMAGILVMMLLHGAIPRLGRSRNCPFA